LSINNAGTNILNLGFEALNISNASKDQQGC
jgi:hypothetical protein